MKRLFEGKRLFVIERDGWEYVERKKAKEAVAVIAVTADRRVVLTEQFRKPLSARVIDWLVSQSLSFAGVGSRGGSEGSPVAQLDARVGVESREEDARMSHSRVSTCDHGERNVSSAPPEILRSRPSSPPPRRIELGNETTLRRQTPLRHRA